MLKTYNAFSQIKTIKLFMKAQQNYFYLKKNFMIFIEI